MKTSISQESWKTRASEVLPAAGFGNFDPGVVIREGKGSRVWDEDGNEFIDYLIGSGPMILGHGHPEILEAVQDQLGKGMTFFTNNARGIELAEALVEAVPCADQVRFVSTGGEADMYAMRLARAFTGRDKILKFEGGYHGMSGEALMSLAPKTLINFPQAVPDSAGIPESVRNNMLIAPFNDVEFVSSLISEHADEIACVIVEPLQRLIPPEPGFLQALRDLTRQHGIILIFDEVVTGFRFAYGGAQEYYGVVPDLCTLGKIIGGGFPLAAIAGTKEIMAHFDKAIVGEEGFTFQIGTLSGNPVASVAGLKTLDILKRPDAYKTLCENGERLMQAFRTHLDDAGVPHQIVGEPMLFDVVFTENPVRNYRDMFHQDSAKLKVFNQSLRASGILKPDSKLYAHLALTEADLQQSEAAIEVASQALVS